jgi:4-hydroxy-L-threonine phosphate dehydrogenase PdxA
MTSGYRPRIAISCGDPNGIGLEVAIKALADPASMGTFDCVLFAPEVALNDHLMSLGGFDLPNVTLVPTAGAEGFTTSFGQTTAQAGKLSMTAFEQAVDSCLTGNADAIVTAPISKQSIQLAGYDKPGHTEYLAIASGASKYAMMMVDNDFRVALVSAHVPLGRVAESITVDLVQEKLSVLIDTLRQDFDIAEPRIAVLGLNPHAGENGLLGSEEREKIIPAMEGVRLEAIGLEAIGFKATGLEATQADAVGNTVTIDGPFPADAFFGMKRQTRYDAVLAMYHDQGLIPFKALAFETGVNYTAGLRIVRTSPDHGTAFDIAGQNKASHTSMSSAIALACQVVHNRKAGGL